MKNKITTLTLMITVLFSIFALVGCTTNNKTQLANNGVDKINYDFEMPEDLWDKSEWYEGTNLTTTIVVGGDYTMEEVLKIASHYSVWVDGERVSVTDYDISFRYSDQRLSGTVKQDDVSLAPSISSGVQEDLDRDFGKYIFIGIPMATYGTLLLDENETYTHTPDEMIEYILYETCKIEYLHPFEFNNKVLAPGYDEVIHTYYRSPNGFSDLVKMHVTVDNFDDLINTSTAEVYVQQIINPDDDLEDAQSDYFVRTIEKVYLSRRIYGPSFIAALSEVLVLKDDSFTNERVVISCAYPFVDNINNYSLIMNIELPDGVWYKKTIEVEFIDSDIALGYAAINDGSFIVVAPASLDYTKMQIEQGIENFSSEILGNENNEIYFEEEEFTSTRSYFGSFNGTLLTFVNSGVGSLLFSTPDKPVDDSETKRDYIAVSEVYYTSNFTVEDVVQALGKDLLIYNGLKPEQEYRVIAEIDNIGLHLEIHIGNEIITWRNIDLIEVTDSTIGNYILGTHLNFVQPILYVEPKLGTNISCESIMQEILEKHYHATELYEFDLEINLNTIGLYELTGLYKNGAGNYYNLNGVFEVINLQDKVTNTNVEWYVEPEPELEPTDYSILEIDTIYIQKNVSLDGLLNLVKEELLLKNGVYCTYDYTISSTMLEGVEHGDEFEVEIYIRYPDDVTRTFMVNVIRLNSASIKIGVIKLSSGSLLVGTSSRNEYSNSQMQQGLDNFVEQYLGLSDSDVTLRNTSDKYTESKIYNNNDYNGGVNYILIGVTGSTAIIESTKDDPVDDDVQKEGYVLYHTIYYTNNYKLEDVLNIVGKYILLDNGVTVNADYKVYIEFSDTNTISFEITFNGNVLIKDVVRLKVVDDSPIGNFIYGETSRFHSGLLILEGTNEPKYKFNTILNYLVKTYHGAWEDIVLENDIPLNVEGDHILEEIISNGNYWNYYLNLKITDFNNELEDSNVDFEDEFVFPGYPDNPNPSDPTNPDIPDSNENTLARILVITLSSVVGVIVIIIIVKSSKKIYNWLK